MKNKDENYYIHILQTNLHLDNQQIHAAQTLLHFQVEENLPEYSKQHKQEALLSPPCQESPNTIWQVDDRLHACSVCALDRCSAAGTVYDTETMLSEEPIYSNKQHEKHPYQLCRKAGFLQNGLQQLPQACWPPPQLHHSRYIHVPLA